MIDCSVDITALIDALRGDGRAIACLARWSSLAISHVAFGELLFGVFKSSNPLELTKVSRLINGMTVLSGDDTTAFHYARIRNDLESAGSMIPQNDIWIAAAALQVDVPLLTRDAHFSHIKGLRVVTY
jgi:tRNA(fMet)-specific endonuclease VapC